MLISNVHRYCFLALQKTASRSMSEFLIRDYEGECVDVCDGVTVREKEKKKFLFAHHSTTVPAECRDYLIFTVVRNPYTRMASVWSENRRHFRGAFFRSPFYRFMEICMNHNELLPVESQSKRIGMCSENVGRILFFEDLIDGVKSLPFVREPVDFPHLFKRERKPARDLFKNPRHVQWVRETFSDDFERFGYDESAVPLESR